MLIRLEYNTKDPCHSAFVYLNKFQSCLGPFLFEKIPQYSINSNNTKTHYTHLSSSYNLQTHLIIIALAYL